MARDQGANDIRRHNRRSKWVLIGFFAIAGYFLITEHRAHLLPFLGYLPYLLLLACPLMHLLHHGGHGRHVGRDSDPANADDGERDHG